jgi:type III pantothenate kinase
MIFVMDVGNTQTTVALYRKSHLVNSWRISTARHRTQDEWGALLHLLFQVNDLQMADVSGVIVCSVVPPADAHLRNMCRRYFKREPIFVVPGIKTGVPVLYDNPSEVGADRIVNAVAVLASYELPAIIVDFGTATTFDVLDAKGNYLGGAIAPGLAISAEALFEKTAKLPKVEISRPSRIVGKTTVQSLQSGLYWGYAGLVEGLLKRMKKELGAVKTVVATGGLARLIAPDCPSVQAVDENLTLEGLRLLYERNAAEARQAE